jgi:hypothetical protein
MSLDIAVLNDDGSVERAVSIGVDAHHRLMALVKSEQQRLLARFRDYYSEGELFRQELVEFVDELRDLQSRAEEDGELKQIVRELIALAEFAKEKGQPLVAVPD